MAKHLYAFQQENVSIVLGDTGHIAIVQPTGSGKTVMMTAIAGALVADGHKVLIGAPQEHIEDGFTRRDYGGITRTGQPYISVPPETIRAARDTNGSIVACIREYLEQEEAPGYALVCTHSALTQFRPPTGVPAVLAGCVLIIDEAHHAAALGLSQFVEAWVQHGGRGIFCTATDFRSDDSPVVLPGMRVVRRTLSRHMQSGHAPRNFRSGIQAVRLPGRVGLQEFYGNEVPAEAFQQEIIRRMVATWQEDGQPKTIVRVPVLSGGSSDMVGRVLRAFRRAGARTLDVTGSTQADKDRFLSELISERAACTYEESQWDVLVGIQRVAEGLDWKWCSNVYCVGLPRSVHTTTQLIGRAARKKRAQDGYPEDWLEHMGATFFVPCADEYTFSQTPHYHAQKVLLVCAYLNNIETARDWRIAQNLSRGLTVRLGAPDDPRPDDDRVEELYPYVDEAFRHIVIAGLRAGRAALPTVGITANHGNLYHWVLTNRPEVPRTVLEQVLAEDLQNSNDISLAEAKRQLYAEINANLAEGRPLRAAITRAFLGVVGQLQEAAAIPELEISTNRIRRQVLELTGHDMEYWAATLAHARPITVEWLTTVCRAHEAQTGSYPTGNTRGFPAGWPDDSWANLDMAIAGNLRDWTLPDIESLAQFCQVYVTEEGVCTVAEVIQVAARAQGLIGHPDIRRLLDSFLARRVLCNGNTTPVPLRDLPAFPEGDHAEYPDVLQLLHLWYTAVEARTEEPITLAKAWLMCERLEAWFRDHRGRDLRAIPTRDRADFTRVWAGTALVFQVRAKQTRLQDLRQWLYPDGVGTAPPFLVQGQQCYCRLIRCPFSAGRGATAEIYVVQGGQLVTQTQESVPVSVYMIRGKHRHWRPMTVAEFGTAEAFEKRCRRDGVQTVDLLVPMDWFRSCLYSEEQDAGPVDTMHRINPLDVINRLPATIDANGPQ